MLSRLKYWSVYAILRWQFILLGTGLICIYAWLSYNIRTTGTIEWQGISDWVNVIVLAIFGLTAFSILTAVIAWITFIRRLKSGKTQISIHIPGDKTPEAGIVPVEVVIRNVLRPILGTIEVRLLFPEWRISDRIPLNENKKSWFWPFNTVAGTSQLDLHHRGMHQVEEVQVVMIDMLKLISLPVAIHAQNKLLTLPREMKEEQFEVAPAATEDQDVRINIPKRVQGEFLSYKDFESGDDIRRIVWKIYARSGELVVRIPETRDPYASHVYMCTGFYNDLITSLDDLAGKELLNVYKDYLRQVYDAVKRNQYSVRIIRDQEPAQQADADVSPDMYFLSTAHWQKEQLPSETFDSPKIAVICLSSAVSVEELENLFSKLPITVPVIVFGLSSALGPPFRFSVRKLFFKDKAHPLNEVRRSWWISPLRKRLQLNETRLAKAIRQRGNAWLMQLGTNE